MKKLIKSILLALMAIQMSSAFAGFADEPSTAPFSVEEVIAHAETDPYDYFDMDYLKSAEGKNHIQHVINTINGGS